MAAPKQWTEKIDLNNRKGTKNQPDMLTCPAGAFQIYPRLGHGLGQTVDPNFDPNYFGAKSAEKHRISCEIRYFMVAETGLEPATSGL